MDLSDREITIQTYEDKAEELAEYFQGIGSRVKDIERAISMVKTNNPKVVEIGCGDGRDATDILKITNNYVGFDISSSMIKIAKKNNPTGNFVVSDMLNFSYPPGTDIVFSFASLLHSPKHEIRKVFSKVHKSLSDTGILYVSLKKASYSKVKQTDQFGTRYFYMYERNDIEDMAQKMFETIYYDEQSIGTKDWLTIALAKQADA